MIKLLSFPTKEERQAQTPFHAIIEMGPEDTPSCALKPCPAKADGYVEVYPEVDGRVVGPVNVAVCTGHYEQYYKEEVE